MTTHGHGEGPTATGPKLYWALFAALAGLTVVEWALFGVRGTYGFGPDRLVPWLLVLSALKFGLVVAWFMRLRMDLGWPKKALLVTLVVGGGLVLAPRILMMS